jgi:nitrilase
LKEEKWDNLRPSKLRWFKPVRGKFDFDVVGHYARADVFKLLVNEEPLLPVITKGDE